MNLIEKRSSLEHRILRPLSGGNLPPTLPEEKGWIKRENLLKLSGRGRTEQLALAKILGVTAYSSPSGGCLLTESAFSDRLRDFYSYPTYSNSQEKLAQAKILRLGRHFKLSPTLKVIVSRSESETLELLQLWEQSGAALFEPINYKGPVAISLGSADEEQKTLIAALLSRYGRKTDEGPFLTKSRVTHANQRSEREVIFTTQHPLTDATLDSWRIGIT